MNKRLLVFLIISCLCLYQILIIINSRKEPEIEFQLAATTDIYPQSEGRGLLGKLGSFPPRCTSKCGRCTPCNPVRMSVPPGTPVTAEYYPEAWRCKCGNRFYMP